MNRTLFETVERILKAETTDLQELARIAGVDPREMYACADLSGADLRKQDISFLKGLNTKYQNAILTLEQKKILEDSEPSAAERREIAAQISALRAQLIRTFVDKATNILSSNFPENTEEYISQTLSDCLLKPLETNASRAAVWQFGENYVGNSLQVFSSEEFFRVRRFAETYFELLHNVRCPATPSVGKLLDEYIPAIYTDFDKARFLSQWRPHKRILFSWIGNVAFRGGWTERAILVANHCQLDSNAFFLILENIDNAADYIRLLEIENLRFSRDEFERIGFVLMSKLSSSAIVRQYLGSDIPRLLKHVLIRQILAQGNAKRIQAVVNWLEKQPGGIGGIAISDVVGATSGFDEAYEISANLLATLGSAQRQSLLVALEQLAISQSQMARLNNLRRRLPHNPLPLPPRKPTP